MGLRHPAPYNLLITRTEPGASLLADKLDRKIWNPIISPLLEILYRTPIKTIDSKTYQAMLITSRHALQAIPPSVKLPLMVVGNATANAARQAGHKVQLVAANAEALFTDISTQLTPEDGPILYLSGSVIQREPQIALPDFRFDRRIVYDALPQPLRDEAIELFRQKKMDVVCLQSAHTAEIFCKEAHGRGLLSKLKNVIFICFSQNIADVAHPLPRRALSIIAAPSERALLKKLEEVAEDCDKDWSNTVRLG